MTATDELTAPVSLAINLDRVSQHHLIELNTDQALLFAEVAQEAYLADLFRDVNEVCPRTNYTPDNPNHGRQFHTFIVGREYSRVVYVRVIKTYRPDFDYAKLGQQLLAIGTRHEASEVDLTAPYRGAGEDETTLTVRYWFD